MKQKKFILFPWGMISRTGERAEKLLESVKECGFNASCFVPKSQFDTCRKLGLEIYCAFHENNEQERQSKLEKAMMDPAVSEQELYNMMKGLLQDLPQDVHSVYITDEPGAGLFPRIKVLVDCIRDNAPWAEAYVNLFPNYAVCGAPNLSQLEVETYEEYLDRFASEVKPDTLSFDNYYVIISNDFQDPKGRISFFTNMIQAVEACRKHDLPFQFIACCNQLRPWQTIPTFANLAFQGYTALAAGARIFSWFLYFGRGGYLFAPIDDTTGEDIKTPTWYILKEANRRILALGEQLADMEYKGLYFSDTADLPRATPIADCPAVRSLSIDRECVVGHYVDADGKDVVLLVNADLHNSAKAEIDLGGAFEAFRIEDNTWATPLLTTVSGKTSPLWLEPGCGILLRKKETKSTLRGAFLLSVYPFCF